MKRNYEHKPLWQERLEKSQKVYKENEEKMKKLEEDNPRNIDMGGGSRSSEEESSWYGSDTI